MSWPTGYCEDCECCQDYKRSWGYEKPHGVDIDPDGVLRCDNCRKNLAMFLGEELNEI
jgi:hypothetical protein